MNGGIELPLDYVIRYNLIKNSLNYEELCSLGTPILL